MTGNIIRIRQGTIDDVPHLAQMQMAMAKETEGLELDFETITRGLTRPFQVPNLAEYYVAEIVEGPQDETAAGKPEANSKQSEGDKKLLAGCLGLTYEWSDWRAGTIYWIQSVYVHPEYRKQGIFRKLFEAVESRANLDEFCGGIRLYVEAHNTHAVETYKRMGMNVEDYVMMKKMKGKF